MSHSNVEKLPPQWMEDSVYIGPDGVECVIAALEAAGVRE